MNINTVTISGNLTRDPDLRTSASGTAIMSFSVAVNERVKNGNSWEDRPNYFDCVAFGGTATYLSERLFRGSKVAVSGRLHWSQWEAKDGSGKRSKVEIFVEDVELLSQAKDAMAPVDAVYEDEPLPF